MTIAEGTPRTTCHHGAGDICGLCAGDRTRAAAAATGRPVAYQVAIELGWSWASLHDGIPHLVPPAGDTATCGRFVPRGAREPVTTGVASTACHSCWRQVLADTPRRTR